MTDQTMASILAEVAERYGIGPRELRGPGRYRHVAWPRQEAMWMMRQTGKWSTTQIGNFFGGRDHTTVLHGVKAYEARLKGEPTPWAIRYAQEQRARLSERLEALDRMLAHQAERVAA